jgi:hypothetical protein
VPYVFDEGVRMTWPLPLNSNAEKKG